MNSSKTKSLVFSAMRDKPFHPPLFLNSTAMEEVAHHTHLGLRLTNNMSWKTQIIEMHQKAAKRLNTLKAIQFKVWRETLISLYKSLIRPVMEYCDIIRDNCHDSASCLLESIQYESARLVSGPMEGTIRTDIFKGLGGRILNPEDKCINWHSFTK